MDNAEIKKEAWRRLWQGQWFWRLLGGGLLLGVCGQAVQAVLGSVLGALDVLDWQDYVTAVKMNRVDHVTPVPLLSPEFICQASLATGLEIFLGWIMTAIASYGVAVILLRCLRENHEGWLAAAFGGFKMPWGVLAVLVRYVLVVLGWISPGVLLVSVCVGVGCPLFAKHAPDAPLVSSLGLMVLFLLASALLLALVSVPFYRYRYLWLVKAENPSCSSGECLRATKRLMKGNMMRAFRLDCAYWKPILLLVLLSFLTCAGVGPVAACMQSSHLLALLIGGIALVTMAALICGFWILGVCIRVGQGLLYAEISSAREDSHEDFQD